MLVVQSTREINELRYVLCPKRLSDATFWQIYFLLAKKLLPDAAFEPAPAPAGPHRDALSLADLQARDERWSASTLIRAAGAVRAEPCAQWRMAVCCSPACVLRSCAGTA